MLLDLDDPKYCGDYSDSRTPKYVDTLQVVGRFTNDIPYLQ